MTTINPFHNINPDTILATSTCRSCAQPMYLRNALGDPNVQLWISLDEDGVSWVSCFGAATGCEVCAGTGDDPTDPEWACPECDGLGAVSDLDHEPAEDMINVDGHDPSPA